MNERANVNLRGAQKQSEAALLRVRVERVVGRSRYAEKGISVRITPVHRDFPQRQKFKVP